MNLQQETKLQTTDSPSPITNLPQSSWSRFKRSVLGAPRNLHDPSLRHRISLIAFLAWVGLGADGLSSSAYGPDIAFRTLGEHTYLALMLGLATAATVFIISYAYSRIIEHFPLGGGGYVVASALLGRSAGVVSGCALLVDYILTVSVSIAGCGDAVFSLIPLSGQFYKFPVELGAIILLTVMNLRGLKESVTILVPIFLTFVITHFIVIGGSLFLHLKEAPLVLNTVSSTLHRDIAQIGPWAVFLLFLRAYSLGGGTYTGIEAVSNGIGIMREPRIETGKKTMRYMAASLAATASGLIFCYMLMGVRPTEGQTLNAVLANSISGGKQWFVAIFMFSEGILLIVAAQAGFIDGPRVMANMAADSWLPKKLSSLSDRLTTQNGILLMGIAAAATLFYTHGHIETLIVMYSLNVFLTFSLSESGMVRFWIRSRKQYPEWKRHIMVHGTGFILCFSIFNVMLYEKFKEGAWITVVITSTCIAGCVLIHRHYRKAGEIVAALDKVLLRTPPPPDPDPISPLVFDVRQPTAGILVSSFNGLGMHVFFSTFRMFPNVYKNVVFISVGVINSDFFREELTVSAYEEKTRAMLENYVEFARRLKIPARFAYAVGTDIVQEASELCISLTREYPRIVFFAGESIFEKPKWYQGILHNETAYAIQRQIRYAGMPMLIMPVVIREQEL